MQLRPGLTDDDVAAAARIDADATGARARARAIAAAAERGGLTLAELEGRVVGFCCLDARGFFDRPFVSLLIVAPHARRRGVGLGLLRAAASGRAETWTSTNRSNAPMRSLLASAGWRFCGEVEGLDVGDPELFFKTLG
ncbi:MAG: GNAT family N-acetyltransferase [Pseudomonadota bacterium]